MQTLIPAIAQGCIVVRRDSPAIRPEVARHLAAGRRRRQAATTALAAITPETGLQERAALLVIAADAARGSRAAELRLEAARAFDESSGWDAVIATLAHVTSGATSNFANATRSWRMPRTRLDASRTPVRISAPRRPVTSTARVGLALDRGSRTLRSK